MGKSDVNGMEIIQYCHNNIIYKFYQKKKETIWHEILLNQLKIYLQI